jgi:hypothetical protein
MAVLRGASLAGSVGQSKTTKINVRAARRMGYCGEATRRSSGRYAGKLGERRQTPRRMMHERERKLAAGVDPGT